MNSRHECVKPLTDTPARIESRTLMRNPMLLFGILLMILLASCGATPGSVARPTVPVSTVLSPTSPPASTVPTENAVLITLHKTGGIAGIDETMTVYADGRVTLRDRAGQLQERKMTDAELVVLRTLLSNPELIQAKSDYQATGADLFTYVVTLGGTQRTITTMDTADQPEIVSQLLEALGRLRPTVK